MSLNKRFRAGALAATLLAATAAQASGEATTTRPIELAPKRVYTVRGDEDFEGTVGFGERTPEVNMMNLMMVGGSGYEGMDMSGGGGQRHEHEHAHGQASPPVAPLGRSSEDYRIEARLTPPVPRVGINTLELRITDPRTRQPVPGLRLKSAVSMTRMDMGTANPRTKETAPGIYQLRVPFSMKGPWKVELSTEPLPPSAVSRKPVHKTYEFQVGEPAPWKAPVD